MYRNGGLDIKILRSDKTDVDVVPRGYNCILSKCNYYNV